MEHEDLVPHSPAPERLFAERTATAWVDITRDDYGFIRPSQRFFPHERLLNQPCSLVVAPPWTGKSFTARRIEASLRSRFTAKEAEFVELLNLEARLHGQPLAPDWWKSWKCSSAPAWWLIDALEEGQRREQGLCSALIDLLLALSSEQRGRLTLTLFARQTDLREVAKNFEKNLRKIYQDDFLVVELLPLDRDNACGLVEDDQGNFDRVLTLISRNSLQAVAGYPAALQYLEKQPVDAKLSEAEIWKGILGQLLDEHGSRQPPFQTEIEHRFAAAQRLAVALTLSGFEEFGEDSLSGFPRWTDVIPASPPDFLHTSRPAAREALRSGLFRPSATGHRFVHRNVREWLAAFGLANVRVSKLRPVLQGVPKSGDEQAFILPEFNDLARLLLLIVGDSSPEVSEWLRWSLDSEPSDLFLRDLSHIQQVLDRLERLASRGGFPDWLEDPQTVGLLMVEGTEAELTSRLRDTERPTDARRLTLQLGTVLELEEVLRLAARIVRDQSEDQELRSWCASALRRTSRPEILRSLEYYIETAEPKTRSEKAMVSTLISALVEEKLWDTPNAFRFMPHAAASEVVDATQILATILEKRMTVEDAEVIVCSLDATSNGLWTDFPLLERTYKKSG